MRDAALAAPAAPLALLLAAVGCSGTSSAKGGPPTGAADAGESVACAPAALVLGGPEIRTPHGTYLMSHVTLTTASFSATLPLAGSLQLDWNGDATAGPVAVTGQLAVPSEDASAPTIWCIDTPSTLHIVGNRGELVLTAGLQGTGLCSATGQPQPTVDPIAACLDVSN